MSIQTLGFLEWWMTEQVLYYTCIFSASSILSVFVVILTKCPAYWGTVLQKYRLSWKHIYCPAKISTVWQKIYCPMSREGVPSHVYNHKVGGKIGYLWKEFREVLKHIGAVETAVIVDIEFRHEVGKMAQLQKTKFVKILHTGGLNITA